MDYPWQHMIEVPESNMGAHFGILLESKKGSDIVFNVEGEKFHAHKVVLAARSPVFRTEIYESAVDKNEIAVDGICPKVFKALLHFIYTDTLMADVDPTPWNLPCDSCVSDLLIAQLLAAADKYGLSRLRKLCESCLCKNISLQTVARILVLADLHNASELKSVCLKFAAENLPDVVRTDALAYITENRPAIQSELLKVLAGREEDSHSSRGKSRSGWIGSSQSGDANGRRVRQRT